jgi:hypothetical protein
MLITFDAVTSPCSPLSKEECCPLHQRVLRIVTLNGVTTYKLPISETVLPTKLNWNII